MIEAQIYFNQYLNCNFDNLNVFYVAYIAFRQVIFYLYFFILFGSCSLLAAFNLSLKYHYICVFNNFFLILLRLFGISALDEYFINYSDIFLTNTILTTLCVLFSYRSELLSLLKSKAKTFGLILAYSVYLFLDLIFIKIYFIPFFKDLTLNISEEKIYGRVIFQAFLFVYFVLSYKIYFYLVLQYSLQSNSKDSLSPLLNITSLK